MPVDKKRRVAASLNLAGIGSCICAVCFAMSASTKFKSSSKSSGTILRNFYTQTLPLNVTLVRGYYTRQVHFFYLAMVSHKLCYADVSFVFFPLGNIRDY